MNQQTVTINGIVYDTRTGLPVTAAAAAAVVPVPKPKQPHAVAAASHAVHRPTQKSQTLNRSLVKKAPAHAVAQPKRRVAPRPDIVRPQAIKKFAPHPAGITPTAAKAQVARPVSSEVIAPARVHPLAAKAHAQQVAKQQPVALKPSQVLKNEAIAAAIEQAPAKVDTKPHKIKKARRKPSRHLSVASAALALVLLGGYFTYLNMPSLSVRVAAAQAGVEATYPSYRPAGYRLDGPVAYSEGEVSMKFASNSGPQNYTISQKKMNWDSSAVEQDVSDKTGGSYTTSTSGGLTIYLYDNNAMWVNGGILYSLNGNAPLSSEQIDHIATSM